MTMHLVGPYMTTTKYNSKKKVSKNKKLLAAQQEHTAWLKKMKIDDDSLEKRAPKNKNGRREGINSIPDYQSNKPDVALSNKVAAHGPAREQQQYTGTLIKGIATMHKSNAVPITNKQAGIDISNMRTGA